MPVVAASIAAAIKTCNCLTDPGFHQGTKVLIYGENHMNTGEKAILC
jgi:hypothetical protein